jgi:gliding motility-associated-like protein
MRNLRCSPYMNQPGKPYKKEPLILMRRRFWEQSSKKSVFFAKAGACINDTWDVSGLQEFPQCAVFVYNRWGQQVFSSVGYNKPWNGEYGGKRVATGVYYYVINLGNNSPPLSGFVTIIR